MSNPFRSSIYLIYGEEDDVQKEKQFKKIKSDILANSDPKLNFDRINGEKDDLMILQDTIERTPFLGEKRLILIEKAPFFGGKCEEKVLKYLESYIENPISTNVLVFMADKVDKRSRIYKKIKKKGEIIQLDPPKAYQVQDIVRDKLAALNLKFEKDAISLLIENTNGNLGIIEQELEKLAAVAMDNDVITADMVDKYISSTIEGNIFKFVDRLGDKNVEPALKQLKELLLLEPIPRVYFMVCRQFRLLNLVKILSNKGYSSADISKELKLPGFVTKKLMDQADKFTMKELNQKMVLLAELDYNLKTSGTFDQKYVLEKVVINN